MQNSVLKFLTVFCWLIFILLTSLVCKAANDQLSHADSLFRQKRYTQSFELYNNLFESKQYTPAMLLKMAYIQEGLNHISQSAYYLNLYYLATQDDDAPDKLEELADKYRLEGYSTSEVDRIFSIYHQNSNRITLGLIAVFIFLLTLIGVQRLRFQAKPYATWTMLLVLSVIFLIHLNYSNGYSKAIIVNNNTYLMDGPSSGASVVSIVRDGHRVNVIGRKDVWLEVQWGQSVAYIKETNLLPVKL